MAVPVVNRKLLEELEAMGFSPEHATRALHFSGNSSTEAAIDWVVDHQNDPDLDQMPRVSIDLDIEAPEPTYVTEEMTMRAQELRDRAEEKKEKKNSRREMEKERIRAGKELLEAKTIAEENERKRYLAVKKAEKEEERRARERILQKLQTDMKEGGKLGLPPETPAAVKPLPPFEDNRRTSVVSYVTKADQMRECLRSLKRNHKEEDARVKTAFQTLLIYVGNVVKNRDNEKFRRIRLSNPVFQSRLGSLEGGVEFLELCGFEKIDGAKFLFLPRDKVDLAVLNLAGTKLKSALSNPVFGLLGK